MMGDIVRDIEKRVINGFMDFIILLALGHDGGCISGYDVIKHVYLQFHFCRVLGRFIRIFMRWRGLAWCVGAGE